MYKNVTDVPFRPNARTKNSIGARKVDEIRPFASAIFSVSVHAVGIWPVPVSLSYKICPIFFLNCKRYSNVLFYKKFLIPEILKHSICSIVGWDCMLVKFHCDSFNGLLSRSILSSRKELGSRDVEAFEL